ncbi:MAG: hypothetical protein HUJ30_07575, partial [Gammaproteobacteria bacterium]|nr:hypothetical protein [Gammaproteobacteria bacterium]
MQNKKLFRPSRTKAVALIWLWLAGYGDVSVAADELFQHEAQLTPQKLLHAVMERNSEVPAMQLAWEASYSRIRQGEALDDPMLSYSFAPQTEGVSGMEYGQKLSISLRLPWPGKRQLRGDAARFEAD